MDGEKGITAVEVILTLSLWTIIMILLFNILFFITRGYAINVKGMDAQYSARMVVFNINRDIRSATQIELVGDEKIIIRGEENISYYQENGIVYRHGKAKIPIAEKVIVLSFSCQNNVIHYSVITGEDDYRYDLKVACSPRALLP
ncbi:MAG TPA: hypothetical protein PKV15_07295 [Syntrophomonadaceae bacterium]|jgi:hypothetical protein|nr:hypothetical protein [Syntrophomonadaceae bacterium]HRX21248.1 hypothetical protein [Syntrophomonadaceae bacterium]